MQASFADNYVPGGNFVRLPGFPDELRDVVPRADGQAGERDPTFYGPDWVRKQRARQLLVQTDPLYQFARMVAGYTGSRLELYWRGGESGAHNEIVDILITNVMSNFAPSGQPLPAAEIAAEKKRIADERQRAFDAADQSAVREHLARTLDGGSAERESSLRMPAVQREFRRVVDESDALTRTRAPGNAAPLLPPPGSVPSAQAPAALGPQPSPLSSTAPAAGRPQAPAQPRQVVTPAPNRVAVNQAEAAAAAGSKRAVDGDGNIVYGIDDKYLMLLRLMLRGGNATQLEAWRMLYEPESAAGDNGKAAKDHAQYLRDMEAVHKMLHAGEGDLGWVNAPQHTGVIFFSDAFGAGVAAAVADVHGLAGKPWATELSLMTHAGVRDLFAQLTALQMNAARQRSAARWGGTQQALAEHRRRHGLLIAAFRRLQRNSAGFLEVPRGRDGQAPSEVDAYRSGGRFATREAEATREQRRAEEQRERETMALTGRYVSDVY